MSTSSAISLAIGSRRRKIFFDLHNDGAIGAEDQVGPYDIEVIDFNAIVDRFFFDTDFLMGARLLAAGEVAPGQLGATRQAWRIAGRLKPEAGDLRLKAIASPGESAAGPERAGRLPASGYVGPYPLRERDDREQEGAR
ncbi:MAG: hypothetical protein HYY95_25545 [Candidatus Rokubacteria bacterium]|nr:hypothetical protein [Candidatus Rokubacteria bacterium]